MSTTDEIRTQVRAWAEGELSHPTADVQFGILGVNSPKRVRPVIAIQLRMYQYSPHQERLSVLVSAARAGESVGFLRVLFLRDRFDAQTLNSLGYAGACVPVCPSRTELQGLVDQAGWWLDSV